MKEEIVLVVFYKIKYIDYRSFLRVDLTRFKTT